jgi:hypothetical protein
MLPLALFVMAVMMLLFASLPGAGVLVVAWFRGYAAPRQTEGRFGSDLAHA